MSTSSLPPLSGALGQLGLVNLSEVSPQLPHRAVVEANSQGVLDWDVVAQLRRQAAAKIATAADDWLITKGVAMPADDRRIQGRAIIRGVVHQHAESLGETGQELWSIEVENDYADAVEDAIFGFGRLQPLLEIADAENIEITGFDHVMVQYSDGRRVAHAPIATSDEELVDAIRFLGETASPPRPFDDLHPTMTLALGNRFRLHAIGFGLSHRPSVVIRQHLLTEVTLFDLADDDMLPRQLAQFLQAAVLARKSIVISGDQGAGKTTLLRALIAAIPLNERFGTLETDYELLTHLLPGRGNVLAMQARVGMGETAGEQALGSYSVADLIPEALRQNLTRLIVGEVRGTEAGAMFEAMQSGAGTLSTTHSHSSASTIDRLAARVAQGGVLGLADAMRQIALHIDFLIHVTLHDDTWRGGTRRRYVTEVRQLTGSMENGRPTTHLVYQAATATRPEIYEPDSAMLAELAPYLAGAQW